MNSTRRKLFGLIPLALMPVALRAQAADATAMPDPFAADSPINLQLCDHAWVGSEFRLTSFGDPVLADSGASTNDLQRNPPIGFVSPLGPPVSACSKCGILRCTEFIDESGQ